MYPAGTRHSGLRTVRDLLNSQDLDNIFGSRAARYKEQFQKIAEKEGILDSDLGDRHVHTKLWGSKTLAWNWLGFFLAYNWGAYWRLPMAWSFVGAMLTADILSFLLGRGQPLVFYIGVLLIFGYYGNTWLFREVIKRAHRGDLDRYSPSLLLAFAPGILYMAGTIVWMLILAPEQLPM